MKHVNLRKIAVVMTAGLLLAGCASTPKAKDAKSSAVYPQPIEKVQKAAVDALTVIGCEIKKQDPTYVEGFRPHKVGAFVGSGGETVGVWLASQGPEQTEVKVTTAKSFVGAAGQKKWDDEVLAELSKSLKK